MKIINELIELDTKHIYINSCLTKYKVSRAGNVYRIKSNGKLSELKHDIDKDGYHKVTIYLNGKGYHKFVHRLVAEAYIPNPDNKSQVNHINGNKNDNYDYNLEWNTCKENIIHAHLTGLTTVKRGDKHPEAVYTNDQIEHVCKLFEENQLSMKEISKITGVTYTVIKQIRNKIIWKSVSKNFNIDNYSVSKRQKYTNKEIRGVCEMLEQGLSKNEISDITNVPYSIINSIYNRKTHKKISSNFNF